MIIEKHTLSLKHHAISVFAVLYITHTATYIHTLTMIKSHIDLKIISDIFKIVTSNISFLEPVLKAYRVPSSVIFT